MRDIKISSRRASDGKTEFSIINMETARGVDILVEKVTKAIYSKTKSPTPFDYIGADIYSAGSKGTDGRSMQELRMSLMTVLRDIEKRIIQYTPEIAPMGERLSKLVLTDLFVKDEKINGILQKVLYLKVRVYPMAGTPEYITFPVDNRNW